jgi:hypothetical protein
MSQQFSPRRFSFWCLTPSPKSEITAVFAADEMGFELLEVSWVSEADAKRGGGAKTIRLIFIDYRHHYSYV